MRYPRARHYLIIALILVAILVLALSACGTTVTYDAEPIANSGDKDCFSIEKETSNGDEVSLGTFCREGDGPALLEDDESWQDD